MDGKQLVTLTVNGDRYEIACAANTTLLEALREKAFLTGTKRGCDLGACGACTVLLDGQAVLACLTLAIEAEGRTVQTIEGIAAEHGGLSPLQKTFVEHGALQCGFCSPGFIMSATELLAENPNPSAPGDPTQTGGEPVSLHGLREDRGSGGDHGRQAAGRCLMKVLNVVGQRVPMHDAAAKITGQAQFTDDLALPGMLHGKLVRSTIPHGRIVRIDVSAAKALPGVKGVITGKDIPDRVYGIVPKAKDEHALARDKVRYIGDEVAAVVAVDPETAEEAARLVKVEYEQLPAVFDPLEAIKDGAPVWSTTTARTNASASHPQGVRRRREGLRSVGLRLRRLLLLPGGEPRAAGAPRGARELRPPERGPDHLVLHADPLLPQAQPRHHPAGAREQGAGDQAQGRGRLRPEDRHVLQGLLRVLVREGALPAGQVRLRTRRAVSVHPSTAPDAPDREDRGVEEGEDPGAADHRPRGRGRVQLHRAAHDHPVLLLHHDPVQDREPLVRGLSRLHQQAGGGGHAWPRHSPGPLRHRAADRPDRGADRRGRRRDARDERHPCSTIRTRPDSSSIPAGLPTA